jgi:hypothetical protein
LRLGLSPKNLLIHYTFENENSFTNLRKLPDLTIQDRPLIAELAKSGINATAAIWDDISIDWVILIIWFSQYLGLFRKENEFNLGLIK